MTKSLHEKHWRRTGQDLYQWASRHPLMIKSTNRDKITSYHFGLHKMNDIKFQSNRILRGPNTPEKYIMIRGYIVWHCILNYLFCQPTHFLFYSNVSGTLPVPESKKVIIVHGHPVSWDSINDGQSVVGVTIYWTLTECSRLSNGVIK